LSLKEGIFSAVENKHHKEREMLEELITVSKEPSAITQSTTAAKNLGIEVILYDNYFILVFSRLCHIL